MLPLVAALIKAGAPIIAGAVAAKGQELVEDKLGVKLEDLALTDTGRLQLKQLELQHEEFLLSNALENRKLDLAETQEGYKSVADARAMQIAAIKSEDLFVRRYVYWFMTGWSIVTAVYVACVTFGTIPPANVRFADTILGFLLGTILASMFQFLLGSSVGSHAKDLFLKIKELRDGTGQ